MLGRLFNVLGRQSVITGTYLLSGGLLLITAWLFDQGMLTAFTMTACWSVVLFFASAGATAAYLTVSEVFPMESRALAIAFFYAIGTAAGGDHRAAAVLLAGLKRQGRPDRPRVHDRRTADDRRRDRRV